MVRGTIIYISHCYQVDLKCKKRRGIKLMSAENESKIITFWFED